MAKTLEIKIYCFMAPVRFSMYALSKMLDIGIPVWACFHICRAIAWARLSTDRDWPWQGWVWIGRDMKIERNG